MMTREGPGFLTVYLARASVTLWPAYSGFFTESYPASDGSTIRIWNTPIIRLARW